jgi:hypothetical protein
MRVHMYCQRVLIFTFCHIAKVFSSWVILFYSKQKNVCLLSPDRSYLSTLTLQLFIGQFMISWKFCLPLETNGMISSIPNSRFFWRDTNLAIWGCQGIPLILAYIILANSDSSIKKHNISFLRLICEYRLQH